MIFCLHLFGVFLSQWRQPTFLTQTVLVIESMRATHIAGRGERPGLLSLPLLFPWSIAPFISSRMALARELRVEAVVYRGVVFSAIEA